jgi:hypothetical protein
MIKIDIPCKIYDTVYYVEGINIVNEVKILYATASFNDQYVKGADEFGRGYTFRKGNFGHDVFMTMEEAKQRSLMPSLSEEAEQLKHKDPLWFCRPNILKKEEEY